ncbi:MAG: hypothetical protein RR403_01145 [Pseudoflavonifractor sp.]
MRQGKILRRCLALLACAMLLAPAAAALLVTEPLMTLTEAADTFVVLAYDQAEPQNVRIIAPDGTNFREGITDGAQMTVKREPQRLYFYLPQAASGDWTISYDKGSNKKIIVSHGRYVTGLRIDAFSLQKVEGNYAQVSFRTKFDEACEYQYIISAVVQGADGLVSGQRELCTGTATTNQDMAVAVPLDGLSSHDGYRLRLEAYLTTNGIEVQDTNTMQEPFSYTSTTALPPPQHLDLTVDLTGGSLTADWSDSGSGEYLFAVFDDDDLPGEPYFSNTFGSDTRSTQVAFDPAGTLLRVELSAKTGAGVSETLRRAVDLTARGGLEILTPEQTNAAQVTIAYDFPQKTVVELTVNGVAQELLLEGKDSLSAPLAEYENQVSVSYHPQEELHLVVSREIYAERTPPALMLYEVEGRVKTADASYILAGETEPGCTLLAGETPVTVQPDGTFLCTLPLKSGENLFAIAAIDPAGNRSVQEIVVQRTSGLLSGQTGATGVLDFLPLILTAIFSGGLLLLVVLLGRRKKGEAPLRGGRGRGILRVLCVVLWCLTVVGIVAFVLLLLRQGQLHRIISTGDFFALAQKSFTEAYEAVQAYHTCRRWMTVAGAGGGIALALSVLVTAILLRLRRKKPGSDPKPPEETPGA